MVILKSFYVDDLIAGADSVENALRIKNKIIKILDSVYFPLRKFLFDS